MLDKRVTISTSDKLGFACSTYWGRTGEGGAGGSWLSPFQHHGEFLGQPPEAPPRVSGFASLFSGDSEICPSQDSPGMKPKLVCLSGAHLRAEGEEEESEG